MHAGATRLKLRTRLGYHPMSSVVPTKRKLPNRSWLGAPRRLVCVVGVLGALLGCDPGSVASSEDQHDTALPTEEPLADAGPAPDGGSVTVIEEDGSEPAADASLSADGGAPAGPAADAAIPDDGALPIVRSAGCEAADPLSTGEFALLSTGPQK